MGEHAWHVDCRLLLMSPVVTAENLVPIRARHGDIRLFNGGTIDGAEFLCRLLEEQRVIP